MESGFLKNLFNRGGGEPQKQTEVTPKRGLYKREEDRDLEMIHELDEGIAQCDRNIERVNSQVAQKDIEIRVLRQQYDKLKNKESPQAKEIANKATQLMHQKKSLNNRIAHYEQQRLTLSTQAENYRNVKEAEAMDKLIRESTIRMQGTIASLDIGTVKGTARDACAVSAYATGMTALIFNPFDISPEEEKSAFLDEFRNLQLSEEDNEEDVLALPSVPVKGVNIKTNKASVVLDDELF